MAVLRWGSVTKAVGWEGTTEDMKVRNKLRGSGGRVGKGGAWRFWGSTSNEVRGARQPTSVVLSLGAPNQCSVVPLGGRMLPPSRGSVFSAQCSVFSFQLSQSPPPLERMLPLNRGVRLSGSFALPRSQSTPLTMQSAVAHRISR